MAFWLWTAGILGLLAVFFAVCLSFVRIRIRYSRSGKLDQFIVIVHALYGLYRFKMEIPTIRIMRSGVSFDTMKKTTKAGAQQSDQSRGRLLNLRSIRRLRLLVYDLLRSVREMKSWVLAGLRKIECTRYRMDIRIGTGDAASTGVATGLCWSVLGIAVGLLDRFVKLRAHPYGSVEPSFNAVELSIVWEADFRIRTGTALAHALRVLPRLQSGGALRGLLRSRGAMTGRTQP
ncbi:DUF2953 domain-containing protein [Cohnella sp. 56]|uniref:DUF2953 domain-containing protein n=1 Tax=Cohnella sp. 56 TaxID=3113722 RepID=UPI0030E7913A